MQATDRLAMIQQMGRLFQQVITDRVLRRAALVLAVAGALLIAGVLPAFLGETHYAFLGLREELPADPARQMDYLRQVAGSKEAAKELKLFGLSEYLTDRFKLSQTIYEENVALLAASSSWADCSASSARWATTAPMSTSSGGRSRQLRHRRRCLPDHHHQQASSNLQQVFSTASGIADQALFLTDLIAFFEMKPTVESKAQWPAGAAAHPTRLRVPQRVVRVSGHRAPHSEELQLHACAGERIALIGENGQGKTTVVKLITRLYDPTEGQILLDGVDLREYSLEDLHREMGVIFQDFMRYEMTARENIAVGRIERQHTQEEIEFAAEKSLAAGVIASCGGYDQMLGRRFEGGVDLSGGEWQKIALARAYLRDAQLLILDEPTAALDAKSELEVFERFAELTAGKMALLISHRFSTVRMADRIVVLAGGPAGRGRKPQQLMALGGRYAEMFEMQAASYR